MSDRREVNVDRPEHSWIPFYRELAEKLVKDSWRERQGELVDLFKGVLRRLRSEGVPTPRVELFLNRYVDPFTIFAVIGRNLTPVNYSKTVRAYKTAFKLNSSLPEKPEIPWVDNRRVGFFGSQSDLQTESVKLWDAFELVYDMDPSVNSNNRTKLIELIDRCVEIDEVGLPKLTGGFYWINPNNFLRSDTVNGVGGQNLGIKAVDGGSYLKCLIRTHELTLQPFPEVNIAVWEGREIELNPSGDASSLPSVWIVRGGSSGASVDYQLENGIAGIGFNLEDVDLARLNDGETVRQVYADRNPNSSSGRVSTNASSVANFVFDLAVGDYVLMPDGDNVYYGTVTSDLYHVADGPWRNRRDVEWSHQILQRYSLPSLPTRTRTVVRTTDQLKNEFLGCIENLHNEFEMPEDLEDSWVPFHLEVGEKLIAGEWWREEKRDQFAQMIDDIRNADPDDDVSEYERWSPDPFSFFLSFNMRTVGEMRLSAYRRVKELLDIDAELPDENHEARGLGVDWGWDPSINDTELSFLWEFFRLAMEYDPATSSMELEDRFIAMYDRAASASFLRGMRARVLSYWLYWIDPTKYLLARRLRRQELGLTDDLVVSEHLATGAEYVTALKGIEELGIRHDFTLLDINRLSTMRETLGLAPIDPYSIERYGIDDVLAEGVFLEREELERMERILWSKKNLILQGPPGVGKTFIARKLSYVLMGFKTEERITSVQFHQSYSYEDFVGGFRPDVEDRQMVFKRQDGPFLRMCAAARANPNDAYVMLIDEINRGNLSRVFGELLMLIEADKRKPEFAVKLQHRPEDDEGFFVPENVYIIGTMNLADRSLTGMNVAMRRRFGFVDLKPQFNEGVFTDWLSNETEMPPDMQAKINTKMKALNDVIADDASLGFNYAVGHSFFCPPEGGPAGGWEEWYETVVDYEIRPLLREYWFDAPDKANEQADTLLGAIES